MKTVKSVSANEMFVHFVDIKNVFQLECPNQVDTAYSIALILLAAKVQRLS